MSERPIILGIVGDSAAGKTTLTKGVAQVLGRKMLRSSVQMITTAMIAASACRVGNYASAPRLQLHGYHAAAHILIRAGQPILKPVYGHKTGTFEGTAVH